MFSKYRNKKDITQSPIVDVFRKHGFSILDLSNVGGGCPDLLVGYGGENTFIECKTGKRTLNPDQVRWSKSWNGGPVYIARSLDQALILAKQLRIRGAA